MHDPHVVRSHPEYEKVPCYLAKSHNTALPLIARATGTGYSTSKNILSNT